MAISKLKRRDKKINSIGENSQRVRKELIPPLFKHQEQLIEIAGKKSRFAFFAEPGTGKTRTGIEIYNNFPIKTLVVCPINLIDSAWIDDSLKFKLKTTPVSLWASNRKKRLELIDSDWEFGIINFESFKLHVSEFEKLNIKRVIIDESSKIKAHGSQISKAVVNFVWTDSIQECYLLSGTPAPNNETEYYPQIKCLSETAFPKAYWAFRNRYFYQYGQQAWEWAKRKEMWQEFEDILINYSIFIKKADCLDLPDQVHIKREVEMTKEQRIFYDTLADDWIVRHGDEITLASTALVEIMKLRQITAGFTIPLSGEAKFVSNRKLKELQNLTEEIGDEQIMVVCQFKYEIAKVVEMLGAEKCSQMHGGIPTALRLEQINNFKCGTKKYMVCHPLSAGHGLTFVNCSYMVFMSQSYSYEEYFQTCQRIHRAGQTRKCTYYHILAKDSVDEIIWKAVEKKEDLSRAILEKLKK